MKVYYFIAFDLGATSGRTILGKLEGEKLTLEEITRSLTKCCSGTDISIGIFIHCMKI